MDVSRCYDGDYSDGFLLDDESMWNDYRWNISNYPACTGELRSDKISEEDPSMNITEQSSTESVLDEADES